MPVSAPESLHALDDEICKTATKGPHVLQNYKSQCVYESINGLDTK